MVHGTNVRTVGIRYVSYGYNMTQKGNNTGFQKQNHVWKLTGNKGFSSLIKNIRRSVVIFANI